MSLTQNVDRPEATEACVVVVPRRKSRKGLVGKKMTTAISKFVNRLAHEVQAVDIKAHAHGDCWHIAIFLKDNADISAARAQAAVLQVDAANDNQLQTLIRCYHQSDASYAERFLQAA